MNNKISILDIFHSHASWRIKVIKLIDYLVGGSIAFLYPSSSKGIIPSTVKNILIIRPGGIGDAVFILPILHALKNKDITVDILCEKRNAEVFTSQPSLIRKVHCYDQTSFEIFKNTYDVIVDTEQWHYLSAVTARLIKASFRIGFATRPQRVKLYNKAVDYNLDGYELNNFIKLFEDFIHPEDIKGIEESFNVDVLWQDWALKQIPQRFVTLFLGASITIRRLNEIQIRFIIQHYIDKNFSIVLLGGGDVAQFAEEITSKISSAKVFNFAGKVSLIHSVALIKQSSLFIGPDSGFMHLASAVGTPVIGIFGPGNLEKWGPRGPLDKIISDRVSCSPCTRFGYTIPTCQKSYHCMNHLKLESAILNFADD